MSKVYRIIENFFKKDHPEEIRKNFTRWFFTSSSEGKEDALRQLWDGLLIKSDGSTEQSFRFSGRKENSFFISEMGTGCSGTSHSIAEYLSLLLVCTLSSGRRTCIGRVFCSGWRSPDNYIARSFAGDDQFRKFSFLSC